MKLERLERPPQMRDLTREGNEIVVGAWLVQGFRDAQGVYYERMREEGRPLEKWYRKNESE